MIYREIGATGMRASVLSMGTWAIGGDSRWGMQEDATSIRAIHEGLDHGLNIIDTAPAYGFGHSERIVGRAVKGRRADVIVSTKCGLVFDGEGSFYQRRDGKTVSKNLSKGAVMESAEQSLKNLGADYIDILITHWQSIPPFFTPISETMEALLQLKKQGKIRAVGISNVSREQAEEYLKYGGVALVQERYSILDRRAEQDILPLCEEKGVTFQAYSPLEQGLLSGKAAKDAVLPEGDVRRQNPWYEPPKRDRVLSMLEGWKPLCEKYGCSPANLVIAWTAARSGSINVLGGARKPGHILENLKGGEIMLEQEDILSMRRDIERLG